MSRGSRTMLEQAMLVELHRHSVRSHLDVSSFSSNMESLEPVQKGGRVFANQGPGGERAL